MYAHYHYHITMTILCFFLGRFYGYSNYSCYHLFGPCCVFAQVNIGIGVLTLSRAVRDNGDCWVLISKPALGLDFILYL